MTVLSGFLSPGTGEILVRIFPGSDVHVAFQKGAAMHLLRLLERYNWAISEANKHADRWRKFWPCVTQIERNLVVMFVRSSNGGKFAGPVALRPLPAELNGSAGDRKLVKIDGNVAQEFWAIRHVYEQGLFDKDDVLFKWHQTHRKIFESHTEAVTRAVDHWRSGGGSIGLEECLRTALFAVGMDIVDAKRAASEMGLEALATMQVREAIICGERPSENIGSAALH